MGFISYNIGYYRKKIEYYEIASLTYADVYEAKQLLKMLDDLADGGYRELYDAMQAEYRGADRLKHIINTHGETPFAIAECGGGDGNYRNGETELLEYTDGLIAAAKCGLNEAECKTGNAEAYADEVINFCGSIGFDKDTAYVFLLRDTLLPYVYYKYNGISGVFPWIINRSLLNMVCGRRNIDDIIRAAIIDTLESGATAFKEFCNICKKKILKSLSPYPQLETAIKGLLSTVGNKKITVIETGCYGTFPLLLSAFDERVTFRMYTTVPPLFETYKDIIYTRKYENLRGLETLYCHDKLFRLTGFSGNKFYVSESGDALTVNRALGEIKSILTRAKR